VASNKNKMNVLARFILNQPNVTSKTLISTCYFLEKRLV